MARLAASSDGRGARKNQPAAPFVAEKICAEYDGQHGRLPAARPPARRPAPRRVLVRLPSLETELVASKIA